MLYRFSTETTVVNVGRSAFDAPLDTSPALYMTNVTIQGNGEGRVTGLSVSSRVLAKGACRTRAACIGIWRSIEPVH